MIIHKINAIRNAHHYAEQFNYRMSSDNPNDIRQYFTPPRSGGRRSQPEGDQQVRVLRNAQGVSPSGHNLQQQHITPNRRRIITSDDEQPMVPENIQPPAEVPNAEHRIHVQVDQAIVIASSEEDDPDDMWVTPRHNARRQQHDERTDNIRPLPVHAQQHRPRASPPNYRMRQQQPHRNSPRQRRRLEAAAVETSASDDRSSDCIESDTDAQDLYRSAIRGVRNARQARQQMRLATEHCPVCANFAAFLAHFM